MTDFSKCLAAEQGDVDAMFRIGCMFIDGEKVAQDCQEAMQ